MALLKMFAHFFCCFLDVEENLTSGLFGQNLSKTYSILGKSEIFLVILEIENFQLKFAHFFGRFFKFLNFLNCSGVIHK